MEWGEFLRYASSTGIAVISGVILSVLVEYVPVYESLAAKWKRLVFFGVCMAVPTLASALAIATGQWGAWDDWGNTWWPAIVAGFVAASSGTLAHTRKVKA